MARLIQVESGTTGTNITTTPGTSSTRSQVLYILYVTIPESWIRIRSDPLNFAGSETCFRPSFNIKAGIRLKNIKCLVKAQLRVEKEKKNMFEIYDILFVYVLGLYSIFLKYHGSAGLLL